jgi:hypothetical protein
VKLRRVFLSLATLLLLAALWIVGGNMWAARREEQSDRAWTATFGSLEDLKKKFPKRETNEAAKRLEGLTRGTVFDLTPVVGSIEPEEMRHNTDWNRSQAMFEFLMAEVARPEASIDPPPEEAVRFLEEKRASIDALESLLIAGPPPEWAFDLSVPKNDRRAPNGLGQIRLQRILMARALAAARSGLSDASARSLEASWNLNESLRGRPETFSALLGIGIARLEVGVLRKVNVEEDLWRKRLATLDSRSLLLDTLVLGYRTEFARTWWDYVSKEYGKAWWLRRAWNVLEAPAHRISMAEYSNLTRDEFANLRDAQLLDQSLEPPTPDVLDVAHVHVSLQKTARNTFARAGRLVVDAELTSKILEAKHLRRENGGRWPAAIPGIETSRFPGASWRYEVAPDGGEMSIALSRALASPEGWKRSLPLRFSSN